MYSSPIVLIIGAGSNVGAHVANTFRSANYRIALVSRSAKDSSDSNGYNMLHIAADVSDPSSVPGIFTTLMEHFGGPPSVVVYNAAAATSNKPNDPLSLPLNEFSKDLAINTTSAFVAVQEAVRGFEQLSSKSSRTFIYTGNILNTTTMAPLLTLGVGKSATAHMVQIAAQAYKDKGWKFYYADERKADGGAAYFDIDGEAHSEQYLELSKGEEQGPWHYTFVKGVGYRDFSSK